jgi:hypothetical protein
VIHEDIALAVIGKEGATGLEIPDQFNVETKWKHFEQKVAPEE